jgi:hypothetical protein
MGVMLVRHLLGPWWSDYEVHKRGGKPLSKSCVIVLAVMASTALDPDRKHTADLPPCLYFGGRDPLAHALAGADLKDLGTRRRATEKRIQAAVAEAEKAGALVRLDRGRNGHNARYRLLLSPAEWPVKGHATGAATDAGSIFG